MTFHWLDILTHKIIKSKAPYGRDGSGYKNTQWSYTDSYHRIDACFLLQHFQIECKSEQTGTVLGEFHKQLLAVLNTTDVFILQGRHGYWQETCPSKLQKDTLVFNLLSFNIAKVFF